MAQQSYLIKILSGSNRGGEIEVFSTSLVVGDNNECDIVLGDPFLEQRTFTMDIFETSVSIKREGLPFYVDGRSITDSEFTAPFYSVITVASTSFVVGETDVVWPDITLPSLVTEDAGKGDGSIDTQGGGEDSSFVQEGSDEGDINEEGGEGNTTEDGENLEEDDAPLFEKQREFVRKKLSLLTPAWFVISIGFILIITYMLWFFFIRETSFGSEEYMKNINTLLRENGYEQIRVGILKPNLLILTGYVMEKKDIETIENLVYDKAPKVLLYIRYLAQILQEMREYLDRRSIHFTLKYTLSTNTIIITGYVKDEELLNGIKKDWEDYLPMFTTIVWKIVLWEELGPFMYSELEKVDLELSLKRTPFDFTVEVSGEATPPDLREWATARAIILGRYQLKEQVLIEKLERVRIRAGAKIHPIQPAPDMFTPVIDEGILTIMGVTRKEVKERLRDLPLETNFDEVMEKDPCKYISIVPGEVSFVGINGEEGMYSIGSLLPGMLRIKDVLEKSIVLENKEGTYIFCNVE